MSLSFSGLHRLWMGKELRRVTASQLRAKVCASGAAHGGRQRSEPLTLLRATGYADTQFMP